MSSPSFQVTTLASVDPGDRRYLELLRVPALSAGVYRLPAGAVDGQSPHEQDEVYLVLEGRSAFVAGEERVDVAPGSVIFVGARVPHRFVDIADALALLVVFAPAEGPRRDDDLAERSAAELAAEVQRLRAGIRAHRDTTEQDLCWHHPALWALLPEQSDPVPRVPDWPEFMRGCVRYRQSLDEQLPGAPRVAGEPQTLAPIGVVRSSLTRREDAPRQGGEGAPEAWLEVGATVAAGLEGLEVGDEVLVLTWLHHADRAVLTTRPRNDPSLPLAGVFATRSPDRPNPIGLHRVSILEVGERRLRVGPLEAIDGTPVLDIKPVLWEGGGEG